MAWQTIKLSSKLKIYPRLKYQKTFDSKVNVVYEYSCDCGDKYIGDCPIFIDKFSTHLKTTYPRSGNIRGPKIIANSYLTNLERRKFLTARFKIVGSNFSYGYYRVITEAIFIKMNQPSINKQIDFNTTNNKKPATLKLVK